MYLDAAVMDMEEALRTLTLIGASVGQLDTHMSVTGTGGEMEGESKRRHASGKQYFAIVGYYLAAGSPTDNGSGSATVLRRYSAMRVVRASDSSSTKLMNAFKANDSLTVVLDSYRAGGDDSVDAQPTFHLQLENARVKTFTLMFGGALPNTGMVEIIEFAFRNITIQAAPQTKTGQSGPQNTFTD